MAKSGGVGERPGSGRDNSDMVTETWHKRVRALTLELVKVPSVTNTAGESAFGAYLYNLLGSWDYFRANPEGVRLERTRGDLRERDNVFALVKGSGPRTVLLCGHYDTVSLDTYGPLAPWACDPEALMPKLLDELRHSGRAEADALALQDLLSGDYLPGRAALDMKSGLAAGLAVLERFAQTPQREGNLLFLATPDEEDGSNGMRSAVRGLPGLLRSWGLTLAAAINLDASVDSGDGSEGQAVFLGSVGKLLPSVYLLGRDTHAGAPFDGVGANLLAAEVTRQVECNPALCDSFGGEVAPPPVSLKQTDLKRHYDVTTPKAAWCAYNLLTHAWTPQDVLEGMVATVRSSLLTVRETLEARAKAFEALSGRSVDLKPWQPAVFTFAELKERAIVRGGEEAERELEVLAERLSADPELDVLDISLRLTEALAVRAAVNGPAAVVGFASLYYPHVCLDEATAKGSALRRAVTRQVEALGREYGVKLKLRPFLPGISDMSFLASSSAHGVEVMAANTPAWGSRLKVDYSAAAALKLPVVNVGPWGRDYHQRNERVYAPYSFGVLPELVWRIARDVLGDAAGDG